MGGKRQSYMSCTHHEEAPSECFVSTDPLVLRTQVLISFDPLAFITVLDLWVSYAPAERAEKVTSKGTETQ